MKINKSVGTTNTEEYLSYLCDNTFLKLWSYANPYKSDGKELSDLIAVFGNHVFLFFDRKSTRLDCSAEDFSVQWGRWYRKVIKKQIKTSAGAARYIKLNPSEIYLDQKQSIKLPVQLPEHDDVKIHRIIVAHGASEACKRYSSDNISGSLAISYCDEPIDELSQPFRIRLARTNPVHIFDSHNLSIILGELDTFSDFKDYLVEKEEVIRIHPLLSYCGEEDLLAYYYSNYDQERNKNRIGPFDGGFNGVVVLEGHWQEFIKSEAYHRRKVANEISYIWDGLIQKASYHALKDELIGDKNVWDTEHPLFEMASEPRVMRRFISERIELAVKNFPKDNESRRYLTFIGTEKSDKAYVFLQVALSPDLDYESEYRPTRQAMLEIACGAAKSKFKQLKKIIGIAIDPPIVSDKHSEDFLLLDCSEWSDEASKEMDLLNKDYLFFKAGNSKVKFQTNYDFPPQAKEPFTVKNMKKKIKRNQLCPCGSGVKYKRCCGR